tara:strand:+ start:57 stop:431 length:375 start_codon:yes stop_codon:yes gene_type:complete
MKTKLTFLLSLTFLFLFGGSVFGQETEVKKEYWDNGKLKSEIHIKNGKVEGIQTSWYENGKKIRETHYKNGKKSIDTVNKYAKGEKLNTEWYRSGEEPKKDLLRSKKSFFQKLLDPVKGLLSQS